MLVDTHCHLNFQIFKGRVREVIEGAKKAGVEKMIVPGTDLETSKKAVELAEKYQEVYAAVGIHPHHARIKNLELRIKNKLKALARNKSVVAIGECGLDYYQYQKTKYKDYKINDQFKQKQKEVFKIQIDLARELKLPLIIHNRKASEDILEIIGNWKPARPAGGLEIGNFNGVFHCFEGDEKLLTWGLKHNFYFGITGNVTYNEKIKQSIRKIPLKNLLTETDTPYLVPEPLHSQKIFPNEPKNVKILAKRIAEIKGDSFLRIEEQTTKNAVQLFKLE